MKILIALIVFTGCVQVGLGLIPLGEEIPKRKNVNTQCAQRWAGPGYNARMSGDTCVVKINGKEFPEQNIRVETSAFEIDYE